MDPNVWRREVVQAATFGAVAYGGGLLVDRNLKVNYTRKINFFALYLVPLVLARLLPYEQTPASTAVRIVFAAGSLFVLTTPVRSRSTIAARMFSSFDRPEDRPHTLWWLSTQLIAGYGVLIPMAIVFSRYGISELMIIPVLIHGLGDGMAEPVGVRFGRHKYRTRAFLGTARLYTRSYEGSACVFVVGVIAVALSRASFTTPELIGALLVVPLFTTLAEAWSPHTWDTPYMFLAGGASLLAVKAWL